MTTGDSKSTIAIWLDKLYSETSSVRSPDFVFRGLENEDWGLESSAYLRHDVPPSRSDFVQYNVELIDKAKNANYHHREKNELTDIELLAELRHYGAATALIDFTRDFLVALWFASSPCKEGGTQKDGKVIIVNIGDSDVFLQLTSDDRKKSLRDILVFNTRKSQTAQKRSLADIDKSTPELSDKRKKLWFWQPRFEINHRLSAQKGVFVFGEAKISAEDIKYWEVTIPQKDKENIRRELDAHFGIDEGSLFNDLPGFANLNDKNHTVEAETADDFSKYAVHLSQKGDSVQAIRYFNKAIELEPDDPKNHFLRGNANRDIERYEDALKDYSKAVELEPDDPNFHCLRGYVNHKLEKYEDALKDYSKAVELEPDDPNFHFLCGHVNHKLEKYEDALKDVTKAVELEPDDPTFHFLCCHVNHKLEKYEDALKDVTKAVELEPDDPTFHYLRGYINDKLEKYEDVLKDVTKAVELEPDDPTFHSLRDDVSRDLEKYEDVQRDIDKAT